MPHDLARGDRASLVVAARAPAVVGTYSFVALPGVGRQWFPHPDNVPATGRVDVQRSLPGDRPSEGPTPLPELAEPDGSALIEVYPSKLGDLHGVITSAGGEFVDVGLNCWAGPEWVSAHFVVRKT